MLTLEDLAGLLEEHRAAAAVKVREFSLGGRFFAFNAEPAIMGGGEPFPGLLVSGERMFDNGKGRATRQNPERARGGNDRCGGGIDAGPRRAAG